ncbi:cytochrome P450 [Gloeophyllum trabeum ATCC 11539]|uniref:Cytochrome P450 n=1 Tax=Gloeophyllum trabeum (strain ATCC 11539 / FP-39264 / Madison 617) TaxID=670483 RepID=S7QE08_GLOTA|nr:cytochrome P450 [Gloeophyllum trabeum ATCC 11539]EPQ57652.1 cytochrome P450 [Gloeophyllum trabeum ATCC 11539]
MEYHEKFMKEYGSIFQVHGLLGEKQIFTSDCAAISTILNDSDTFRHTEEYDTIATLIFGPGIIGAQGRQHKRLRRMLNPIFSSHNIRELTGVFFSIAHKLRDCLEGELPPDAEREINILEWTSRAALDLIGIGGAGYRFGALDGSKNAYTTAAKGLLPTLTSLTPIVPLLPYLHHLGPSQLRRFLVRFVPWPAVQRFRRIIDVMDRTAWSVYRDKKRKVREKVAVGESEGGGRDVISLAIAANENADVDSRLTDEELAAQMGGLIFAGLDTTSGALCRTLQVLSTRPDLQRRLRAEIADAKQTRGVEHGHLDYETLHGLRCLGAVCQEVLRLYPPVTWFDRTSHVDISIPLASPLTTSTGKQATSVPVLKGTTVIMSVHGVNRDKALWGADAEEFNIDRWLLPERAERRGGVKVPSVWSSLLSFGAGPRACIGFRYALLELKVVLSVLIESFEFSPTGKTVEWSLSFTQSPHVKGEDAPGMPLLVRRRAVEG